MKLICPKCGSTVAHEDVHVASESAACSVCGNMWDCRNWIKAEFLGTKKLGNPPPGVSYRPTINGFQVAVSTRSLRWLFWLPFACIASAILFFFAYVLLIAHPIPGSVDPEARRLMILFLIPFWLLGVFLWFVALIPIFGKIVFTVEGQSATIFEGIGFLGWRRRLNWEAVKRVRLGKWYSDEDTREQLVLEGDCHVVLARGVQHRRLIFMLTALQTHRANKGTESA